MKQLKFNTIDLRKIFELITTRYITEFELVTADGKEDGMEVQKLMNNKNFDIIPVKSNGKINGYVETGKLTLGNCLGQMQSITNFDLVAESTPILTLFDLFNNTKRKWFLVLEGNDVKGIVTIGDLRKAPVRMFLFALVNLIEMHLTKMIREYFLNNFAGRIKEELSKLIKERLKEAENIHKQKKDNGEDSDIFDCLQLCDKITIAKKKNEILEKIKIDDSKKKTESGLKRAERLRNRLAHGNDIVVKSWDEIFKIADFMEQILTNMIGSMTQSAIQ